MQHLPHPFASAAVNAGGSFWQRHLDRSQRTLSAHLALLGRSCRALTNFSNTLDGWAGKSRVIGPVVLSPDDCLLVSTGGGIGEWEVQNSLVWQSRRLDSPSWSPLGLAGEDSDAVVGEELIPLLQELTGDPAPTRDTPPLFLLVIPSHLTALTLAGASGMLHAGVHFESRPGLLVWRDHPDRWLAAGPLVMTLGLSGEPSTADFMLSADVVDGREVSTLYRYRSTTGTMLAAACSAAGLVRVEHACRITGRVLLLDGGAVYLTDKGDTLEAAYQHKPLEVGQEMDAGEFIGAKPRQCNGPGLWWVDAPWGEAVDLSAVGPFDLLAYNRPVNAVTATSPSLKIYLEGPAGELDRWWASCAAGELASGHTLASAIGISAPPDTFVLVNPVHVFAEHLWSATTLVISLDAPELADLLRDRMKVFLERERPLGKAVLVLDPQPSPLPE